MGRRGKDWRRGARGVVLTSAKRMDGDERQLAVARAVLLGSWQLGAIGGRLGGSLLGARCWVPRWCALGGDLQYLLLHCSIIPPGGHL